MDRPFASLLDVENTINMGFAVHMSRGHGVDARLAAKIATSIDGLDSHCADDVDRAYLFSVRTTILVLSAELAEAERHGAEFKEEAERWRDGAVARLRDAHMQTFWSNLATRAVMYGGIGFAILGTLDPAIQAHMAQGRPAADHFSLYMGFVGAIVFAAGSRVVQAKLVSKAEKDVESRYDRMCVLARRRYLHNRLSVLRSHRDRARNLWQAYAGEKPPDFVSVVINAAEELRAHENEMRERKRMTTTLLKRILSRVESWRHSGKEANHAQHT